MSYGFWEGRLAALDLRYVLVVQLVEAGRTVNLRDLVTGVVAAGFVIDGRASKTISDALRWEVRRGRVVRRGRGLYAAGRVPRQTLWRMRRRVAWLRTQVVAPRRDNFDNTRLTRSNGQPV
jgi:hypothetical protein